MRVAVVGSRFEGQRLHGRILRELPAEVTEIISGGAAGVDTAAAEVAAQSGIPLRVIRPEYELYGRAAPLVRNRDIADRADLVLCFWDGQSAGTANVIAYCIQVGKPFRIVRI